MAGLRDRHALKRPLVVVEHNAIGARWACGCWTEIDGYDEWRIFPCVDPDHRSHAQRVARKYSWPVRVMTP